MSPGRFKICCTVQVGSSVTTAVHYFTPEASGGGSPGVEAYKSRGMLTLIADDGSGLQVS